MIFRLWLYGDFCIYVLDMLLLETALVEPDIGTDLVAD